MIKKAHFYVVIVVLWIAGWSTANASAASVARRTSARSYSACRDVQATNYELGIQIRKLKDENEEQRQEIEALRTILKKAKTGQTQERRLEELH